MVKVNGASPKAKTVNKVAPKAKTEASAPAKPARETADQFAARVAQADLDMSVGRHPGGMEPPLSVEASQAAIDAQFAAADNAGDPRFDEQAAVLAVRGF